MAEQALDPIAPPVCDPAMLVRDRPGTGRLWLGSGRRRDRALHQIAELRIAVCGSEEARKAVKPDEDGGAHKPAWGRQLKEVEE